MEQSLMDTWFFTHMSLDQPYAHMAASKLEGHNKQRSVASPSHRSTHLLSS